MNVPYRPRGLSIRMKLTLTYAGVAALAGGVIWAVALAYAVRYVPTGPLNDANRGWIPNQQDLLNAFLPRATLAYALVVLAGFIGGWFLAGRVLRPVHAITDAARLVSRGSLSHRIAMPGAGDELHDLADVFDDMVAQVEGRLNEQRRFAANASHELRTPLAVTRTMLEVAATDPDADTEQLIRRLASVNDRASATIEALLLLSRVDNVAVTRVATDLSLAAEEALESALPLAEKRGVTLIERCDPAPVNGDPVLLARLAANLIGNAIAYSGTTEPTVWVCTEIRPGARSVITVENTGAELDLAAVATFTEPFARGERTARRAEGDTAGVGLGLAITASIVRAHGGSLQLYPRPGGGLYAEVSLPS